MYWYVSHMGGSPPLFVLDDDPTGTQAVRDVPVLLRWRAADVADALALEPAAIHLMTNTRAFPPARAEVLTEEAARAATAAVAAPTLVLRGDSTLRGHVLEEYRAVHRALGGGRPPVLLLVPALPAAGRFTRGGVHWLRRDGRVVALHDTEYARDGGFAYRSARLLEWAQERSDGWFAAKHGVEVGLAALRAHGGDAVAEALTEAWGREVPAVCAPDAETIEDLQLIAAGLRRASEAGTRAIVRCAPAFAGVLSGTLAEGRVAPPPGHDGVLVVCGSYVPGSTRQLEALAASRRLEPIELDPRVLAGPGDTADGAVREAGRAAVAELDRTGLAVVATARARPPGTQSLDSGMRIARNLARVVAAVGPRAGVVVAKGGITSAVTLEVGLGASAAWVAGPLLPGVALWQARCSGREVAYVVVPGNVGGPELLADVVDLITQPAPAP
jgi:uncharacterized protein YgbK (DUF1537 family)